MIVLNGLRKIAPLILAGSTGIGGIDVVGVNAQHSREVLNALIDLPQLLKGASPDIVSPRIGGVQLHQLIAVLDGLSEAAFLQKG